MYFDFICNATYRALPFPSRKPQTPLRCWMSQYHWRCSGGFLWLSMRRCPTSDVQLARNHKENVHRHGNRQSSHRPEFKSTSGSYFQDFCTSFHFIFLCAIFLILLEDVIITNITSGWPFFNLISMDFFIPFDLYKGALSLFHSILLALGEACINFKVYCQKFLCYHYVLLRIFFPVPLFIEFKDLILCSYLTFYDSQT